MKTKIQLLLIFTLAVICLVQSIDQKEDVKEITELKEMQSILIARQYDLYATIMDRTNYLFTEIGILQDVVSEHTVRIVNLEKKKPRLPEWIPDIKPGGG